MEWEQANRKEWYMICECFPPPGIAEAPQDNEVEKNGPDPPRGRPVGGGGVHRKGV